MVIVISSKKLRMRTVRAEEIAHVLISYGISPPDNKQYNGILRECLSDAGLLAAVSNAMLDVDNLQLQAFLSRLQTRTRIDCMHH